jgi:DNA-binding transcriptional LysR family regulator
MSMTALIYLMPAVIRDLKASLPLIEVVMRTDYSEGTLQSVRDNEIDIGLCLGPVPDKQLSALSLGADQMVAIFPPDSPDVPEIADPETMSRWPIILGNPKSAVRVLVENWLKEGGPVARPIMELNNVAGIKSVVGAGIGASIVPEVATRREDAYVIVRPLAPPIARELFLVQRKDKAGDAAIRQVHEVLVRNLVNRA